MHQDIGDDLSFFSRFFLDVCLLGTHGTVRVVLHRVANAFKGAKYSRIADGNCKRLVNATRR